MSHNSTSSSASIFWRSVHFGFFVPNFFLIENTLYNPLVCGGYYPALRSKIVGKFYRLRIPIIDNLFQTFEDNDKNQLRHESCIQFETKK